MAQKRRNIELDIIQLLLKEEIHTRGIAKKLGAPHSTILRKLDSLAKNNVLGYRREGKNKVFYLKDNFVAESYIIQSELNKRIVLLRDHPRLTVIFKEILNKTRDELVILFGSYAKNLAKKNSDIDIYIKTNNLATKKAVEEVYPKINVKIGHFDIKSPLIREIIQDHVIIRGLERFYELVRNHKI